jgi:hypothetical protein
MSMRGLFKYALATTLMLAGASSLGHAINYDLACVEKYSDASGFTSSDDVSLTWMPPMDFHHGSACLVRTRCGFTGRTLCFGHATTARTASAAATISNQIVRVPI